jgi:hypothetical protein
MASDPKKVYDEVIREAQQGGIRRESQRAESDAPFAGCFYDGKQYSEGAEILVGNHYLKCQNGQWVRQ